MVFERFVFWEGTSVVVWRWNFFYFFTISFRVTFLYTFKVGADNIGIVVTSRQVNVFLISPSIFVDLLMTLLTLCWNIKSWSIYIPGSFSTSVDGTDMLFMVYYRCWFLFPRLCPLEYFHRDFLSTVRL